MDTKLIKTLAASNGENDADLISNGVIALAERHGLSKAAAMEIADLCFEVRRHTMETLFETMETVLEDAFGGKK